MKHFVAHFLELFLKEEYIKVFGLFSTTIAIQVIQTKGISETSSKLIDAVHHNRMGDIMNIFYFYAFLMAVMLLLYHLMYSLENQILTKLRSWARHKIVEAVIRVNHDINFSDINFTKLNSPIHRLADLFSSILNRVMSNLLPNSIFLFVVSAYFFQISPLLSIFFFTGNILIAGYYYYFFDQIIEDNVKFENLLFQTDAHMIDLLNNIDKIVYRGQADEEVNTFLEMSTRNINTGTEFYEMLNNHSTIASLVIYFIMVASIWYMLKLFMNKKMTAVFFVTSLTLLLLYKEKLEWLISQIPDTFAYIGRVKSTLQYFTQLEESYDLMIQPSRFKKYNLEFKEIEFRNVTYKYKTEDTSVFQDRSYIVRPEKSKIIGITGVSGRGKSTFIKLMLKMNECEKGEILIDGVNIHGLDPLYIRKNITYVNQNSKLFDKKVVENMLYGCSNREICDYFLKQIMQYPHIAKLYKNVNIEEKNAGLMGENLSGGQRQVVNMIGGLINPTRILVLDEPTNGLDPALKKEVISIIKDFSKYKQAVFIITHDKDVFKIFDEELRI
jgi:ABC-type bacteriocin/lantibiotic exporter with double-glycine peptidase domain